VAITRSADASGLLREGKFDVVLLDLHMASPDGMELVRQMRCSGINRMTPIILISDDQRPSALSIGFEAGANFFLYKPIDRNRLSRLIRATQGINDYEKRRTRRVSIQSKVRLRFGADELEGETIDVGISGVLVRMCRTIPVGSPVQASLYLSPQMRPIVGRGSVVRVVDGNRMGIHLSGMIGTESERLQEFLLRLIPTR
jgi:CheY-like chemotaxis protein